MTDEHPAAAARVSDDPLRILIVDDEPLARARMAALCAGRPDLELVGVAEDHDGALALASAARPDLVLLDIAMPGPDGFAVAAALARLSPPPAILFCTAHDRFAVAAFEIAAVDFLLKPVSAERLARAVARARLARATAAPSPVPVAGDEFWVPVRHEMIRIPARQIDRVEAERDYMRLHVGSRSYLLHETIGALEKRLDPALFLRVHRSTILRRDRIVRLRHDGLRGCYADLVDGDSVRIGRTYLAAARALIGNQPPAPVRPE
jgi:two-component system response regulator AlgR